jgi:hypothetical protein
MGWFGAIYVNWTSTTNCEDEMNVIPNVVITIFMCVACLTVGFVLGKIDERSSWRTSECISKGGSMITYNGSVICAKVEKLK